MITNRQLIADSLMMLGVLAETQPMSAEQAEHGLRVLNSLMTEWQELGLITTYYSQTAISEECPIPEAEEETVKAALAVRLASYYKGSDPSLVSAIAGRGYQRLLRAAINDNMRELDMTHLPGAVGVYNIL